jgi:hypothetical protein
MSLRESIEIRESIVEVRRNTVEPILGMIDKAIIPISADSQSHQTMNISAGRASRFAWWTAWRLAEAQSFYHETPYPNCFFPKIGPCPAVDLPTALGDPDPATERARLER